MNGIKQDLKGGFEDALDDLRTMRDEIRVKLHLAGMDAKDAFAKLEPRLNEVEREVAKGGDAVADALDKTVDELGASFRKLRDQLREKEA
jgi:hypothetical protein